MRPPDLPSVCQLASNKPHGHKMRYLAGCRCWRCKRGNRAYEETIRKNRELYGPNDLVPVDRLRTFLRQMQQLGVGYMTIAKHVGVGKTALGEILWAGKATRTHIRRRTEAKVLAYQPTLDTLPRNCNVWAEDTFRKLNQLIRWGYPKAVINRDALGHDACGLQIARDHRSTVTVKTALKIREFFSAIESIRERWQRRHGPIPRDHFVYWKKGRTGGAREALELRSISGAYAYHYLFPPDLKAAIRLTNQLKRACRQRSKNEKHHGRCKESCVRRHRSLG